MKKVFAKMKKELPVYGGLAVGGGASQIVETMIPFFKDKPQFNPIKSAGLGLIIAAMTKEKTFVNGIGLGLIGGAARGAAPGILKKIGISGPFIGEENAEDYAAFIQGPEEEAEGYVYAQTVQGVAPEYNA